jgi:uncharacterized protein
VRAISRNRETGKMTERFMLLTEPHCLGFQAPKEQTVRQWIIDQDIAVYNRINDRLMEIISLKNRLHPGALDLETRRRFYTALYDLDDFKDRLFNNRRLWNLDVDPQKLKVAETDDAALLEVGMEWVRQVLLNT